MAQITYKSLKHNPALKNLPILTLDQRWYRLVPEVSKTDEIRYWEKRVNELLKKQGQLNEDILQVKKLKKGLLRGIVNTMEEDDNNPKKQKIMSESQRLVYEAKDKIASLEEESEDMPKKLRDANLHLFVETVKMCYARINQNNEDLEVLDQWIEQTRIKLKKNLLIKQDKEDMNNQMYSSLHAMLGPSIMSELDRINDDE
jgi:hypothetical protein